MNKNENPKKDEINPKMVPKVLKMLFFSLIRLRFYMPGIPEIKAHELNELLNSDQPPLLIDMRDKDDYYVTEKAYKSYGHIPNAKLIPGFQFPYNIENLSDFKEKEIVTICPGGGFSLVGAEILLKAGFTNVKSLRGGMNKWHKKGFPTTKKETDEDLIYFTKTKPKDTEEAQTSQEGFSGEIHKTLDARKLSCPVPVLKSKKEIVKMEIGHILEILTTDPGSKRDIPAWANMTGQEIISIEDKGPEEFRFIVKRLK